MSKELSGRRVLAITSNFGVEQDELMVPVTQLAEHGATVDIGAVNHAAIVTVINDRDHGITVMPQLGLEDIDIGAYDVLVVPGGTRNADAMRQNPRAVDIVSAFGQSGKIVASICHGPWLLVEAGMARDRTLTSYPSLRTDIRNAGGTWVNEPVVRDGTAGQALITSRTPNDLNRFVDAITGAMITRDLNRYVSWSIDNAMWCRGVTSAPVLVEMGVLVMVTRVFLVDDHDLVRRGIADVVDAEDDLTVAADAASVTEALRLVSGSQFDVAVLDVRLPDGSGVELCRELKSRLPELQCLMLTSYADDEALFDAIMAGASGFVLKQAMGADLMSAIRTVAAGKSLLDAKTATAMLDRLRREREDKHHLHSLSDEERVVLDLIAEGLTNRQIAYRIRASEKNVRDHVSALLGKLQVTKRTEAAVVASQVRTACDQDFGS